MDTGAFPDRIPVFLDHLRDRVRILRGQRHTLPGLLREARSFGIIGAANAVADTLLFTLLHAGAGIGPLTAKVTSGLLTTVASYYANRRWTWPHRPGNAQHRRQLAQFTVISAVGLLLAEACLGVSHYLLDLHSILDDNLAANVVGLALGTIWRFLASRRWVFTDTDTDRAAHAEKWKRPDWIGTSAFPTASLADLFDAEDITTGHPY